MITLRKTSRGYRATGRQFDVPSQPDRAHRADHHPTRIKLIPQQTVLRRGRKSVMVVVPTLAHAQQSAEHIVGGMIVRPEMPSTKEVTDRVDRPSHMVSKKHAHQSAPQEAKESAEPRRATSVAKPSFKPITQGCWNRQAHEHEQVILLVHPHQQAIAGQVRNVLFKIRE